MYLARMKAPANIRRGINRASTRGCANQPDYQLRRFPGSDSMYQMDLQIDA